MSARHVLKAKNIEVIEVIPPAINTDLGGKGLHDAYPPVSDFIASVFEQLKEGKTEVTFLSSETRAAVGRDEVQNTFNLMNQ